MFADVEKGSKPVVGVTGAEDMLTSMANVATYPGAVEKAERAAKIAANVYSPTTAHNMPEVGAVVNAFSDPRVHRVPPGAETLWGALTHLPSDLTNLVGHLVDNLHMAGPVAAILGVLSGGGLQWIMYGLFGLRMFTMLRSSFAPKQQAFVAAPLAAYMTPTPTAEPVIVYLSRNAQVQIREVTENDQGMTTIKVPIYHSGRADRAFAHLKEKTNLSYIKL